MSLRSAVSIAVFAALSFVHLSCGTSTMFAGMWADPRYQNASINKILVIGMFDEPSNRREFEVQVAKELMERGVQGVPSSDSMPHDEVVNEQSLRKHFSDMDIDAVLMTTFAGGENDRDHTPDATYVVPTTHQNLYEYYLNSTDYVDNSDYWIETTIAQFETNLYETEHARLIWSGLTESHDSEGALDVIESLPQILVSRLAKEGFLRSG